MATYRICGEISRSGVVEVEAESLEEALAKAAEGQMEVVDEQDDPVLRDGEPTEDEDVDESGAICD